MSWAVWVLIRTRMSFVNRMHASEPTDAHEIEDDRPLLCPAEQYVLDEGLCMDDEDEEMVEASGSERGVRRSGGTRCPWSLNNPCPWCKAKGLQCGPQFG